MSKYFKVTKKIFIENEIIEINQRYKKKTLN